MMQRASGHYHGPAGVVTRCFMVRDYRASSRGNGPKNSGRIVHLGERRNHTCSLPRDADVLLEVTHAVVPGRIYHKAVVNALPEPGIVCAWTKDKAAG